MESYLKFNATVKEQKKNITEIASEECWQLRNKFCNAVHHSKSRLGFDGATPCMDCPFSVELGFDPKIEHCDVFLCENSKQCIKIMKDFLDKEEEPKGLEESNKLFMYALIGYSNKETEQGLGMLCNGLSKSFNSLESTAITLAKEIGNNKVTEITELFGGIQEVYKNKIKEWEDISCDFAVDSKSKIVLAEEMVELYKYLHATVMEMLNLEW